MTTRHLSLFACVAALGACTASSAPPAHISFDASAFAQTADVESVGLLILGAPLASADEETQKVESTQGASDTTQAMAPTTTKTGTDVRIGVSTTETPNTGPARATNAEETTGDLVIPKTATSSNTKDGHVDYFELDLAAGQTTFSVDVSAGHNQSLFLYGFGPKPAGGGARVPTYVAAALNVTLQPAIEQEVHFAAYGAGVLAPQVLAPSLIGLVDAAGAPITALPADFSCLAVAKAIDGHPDFPAEMVGRVRIGSIAAQASAGAPGVLVLPTGKYQLDCLANFAGKLFGFDPKQPMIATVERGKVTLATGALIKLRDLAPAATTATGGTATTPPSSTTTDPTVTTMPTARPPRFAVSFAVPFATAARTGGAISSRTTFKSSNLQAGVSADISVAAINDDGTPDSKWSGAVELSVLPAFDPSATGDDVRGGAWMPFIGAQQTLRVLVVDGAATISGGLRAEGFSSGVAPMGPPTYAFVIVAQPLDASGNPARVAGARYFSMRPDAACSQAPFDRVAAFTLSNSQGLTLKSPSAGHYDGVSENVLMVALGLTAPDAKALCAFEPVPSDILVGVRPAGPESVGRFILGFDSHFFDTLQLSGFLFRLPAGGDGQQVFYDIIKPAVPTDAPAVGFTYRGLGMKLFSGVGGSQWSSDWLLDIAVR